MMSSLGFLLLNICQSEEPFEGGDRDALKFRSLGFIQDHLIVYGRGFVRI